MTDAIESQRDAFILWQRVQEAESEARATGAEREKWKARAETAEAQLETARTGLRIITWALSEDGDEREAAAAAYRYATATLALIGLPTPAEQEKTPPGTNLNDIPPSGLYRWAVSHGLYRCAECDCSRGGEECNWIVPCPSVTAPPNPEAVTCAALEWAAKFDQAHRESGDAVVPTYIVLRATARSPSAIAAIIDAAKEAVG